MSPELCADRLEQVRSAVGASRTLELADALTTRVADLLEAISCEAQANDDLAAQTHQIRSAAGALALLRLSDNLARLETALRRPHAQAAVAAAARTVQRAMSAGAAALCEAISVEGPAHPSALAST